MVLEMGGTWPYTRCFVGCSFQSLFSITCSIIVQSLSTFFSALFVSLHSLIWRYKMTPNDMICYLNQSINQSTRMKYRMKYADSEIVIPFHVKKSTSLIWTPEHKVFSACQSISPYNFFYIVHSLIRHSFYRYWSKLMRQRRFVLLKQFS